MERNTKKVSDSMVEQVFQVRPEHLNGAGRLFGGQLMAWIDEVAGLVGIRHSNGDVITASVDGCPCGYLYRGSQRNPALDQSSVSDIGGCR